MIEFLTFIPAAFELAGVKLLGDKKKLGFVSSAIGNILWISYVCLNNSTYGLLFVCGLALVLNVRGYVLWKRN